MDQLELVRGLLDQIEEQFARDGKCNWTEVRDLAYSAGNILEEIKNKAWDEEFGLDDE